jgi:transposase
MDDTLFPLPPAEEGPLVTKGGKPRVQRANRQQVQWQAIDLDSILPADHAARMIWDFVQQMDLSPLYQSIRAVEGQSGRDAIDPAILMALWLLATLQGVGSARALDRLCEEHEAYRWICGGVRVNYHTLADFRVQHSDVLDELLTKSVAALMAEGLVSLERVAQDGKRVRASAGSGSFRRRPKLESALETAKQQVAALHQELEAHPEATSKRQKAARERAARERQERVEKALQELEKLEAHQQKRSKRQDQKHRNLPQRASTTDADARRMKMADGGTRPAYNVQFCTDTATQVIGGVKITNVGSDKGSLEPMMEQLEQRYQHRPKEVLADGGCVSLDDFDQVQQKQTVVYAPLPPSCKPDHNPYLPLPTDPPSIAAWRQRMATEAAQQIYKLRAATAECVNAIQTNRGLQAFRVKSLEKVKAVVLWFALLHTLLRGRTLRLAAGLAG